MIDDEKTDDGVPLGAVTGAGFGGNGLGISTDSLLRDRLRYSNSDTCIKQEQHNTVQVIFKLA